MTACHVRADFFTWGVGRMGGHFDGFAALTFGLFGYPLMLAHVVALVWFFWRRRDITPILAVNFLVSGGVMATWVLRFDEVTHDVSTNWAVVAFEIAVFATSLAALFGMRVPRAVIFAEFALQMMLIAVALYFIITFKITRVI